MIECFMVSPSSGGLLLLVRRERVPADYVVRVDRDIAPPVSFFKQVGIRLVQCIDIEEEVVGALRQRQCSLRIRSAQRLLPQDPSSAKCSQPHRAATAVHDQHREEG